MFLKVIQVVAGTAVVATVLSGCTSQTETQVPIIELASGDKKVEILGSFSGDEALLFETELAAIEKRTGVDITYTPAPNFNSVIAERLAAGNVHRSLLEDRPAQSAAFPRAAYG